MKAGKLSLCVLGCGRYAADFSSSLLGLSGEVDLYFASRDLGRAKEYCLRFGGEGYFGSYSDAANDSAIDSLYVCTPHHLHRQHAELGISRGKHILVEKPLAHNLEDGLALISAARSAGLTLMVAENLRYFAQVRKCKELVSEGAVGTVRLVQFQEEYPFQPGGWRSDSSLNGGGVFIDGGIHKVHFMRYLLGDPDTVFAAELPKAIGDLEGEDGIMATLVWATGAVGSINHSWTTGQPKPPSVEVSGTRGRIAFQIGSGSLTVDQGSGVETWQFPPDHRGIPAMVREFKESIVEGRVPETSGEEGLRDVELVLATYESARLGKSVTFKKTGQP